jgi:hypothetical protein
MTPSERFASSTLRGGSLLKRKLNSVVHTRCGELEIDHSSELVGHEFAY